MFSFLYPRQCACCQRVLLPQEGVVCLSCLATLPRVHAFGPMNEVERRLFGMVPFQHATSFCYYAPGSDYGGIIRQAKFGSRPWLNVRLARLFVQELRLDAEAAGDAGWPYDADVIVPIPLHWLRLLHRGYNQSMGIAEELSRAWRLPIESRCLYKRRYTASQVGLSGSERRLHEDGSFAVRHPERLAGRHILLVDDVLTTGATLRSASDALIAAVPGIRISVLTLALASN